MMRARPVATLGITITNAITVIMRAMIVYVSAGQSVAPKPSIICARNRGKAG